MSLIDFPTTSRAGRMSKLASGEPLEHFGVARLCEADGCGARLSRYNPAATCSLHRGWAAPVQPRRRTH